jgi:two-component system NtrC family sensor kinase
MTIRLRITIGFIAIILVANSVLYFVTVRHTGRVLIHEVQTRVRLDLNSAWTVYNNRVESIDQFLHAISLDSSLAQAMKSRNGAAIGRLLRKAQEQSGIDMLSAIGMDGKVIYRTTNPTQSGDDVTRNLIIAKALKDGKSAGGTTILERSYLEKEGKELADRAYLEILPTPAAMPTDRKVETSGMVTGSAVFVYDEVGRSVGLIYGGNLLNRRYRIVDSIKNEVFQGQTYLGKDIGTATIFQGDLRISTNVRNKDGTRAIGTRVSAAVYDKVLVKGEVWSDRAFVVNDWYITAYSPIRDPNGSIIGILYVGLLEAPFVSPQKAIVDVFLVTIIITTLIVLGVLYLQTQLILRPITRILAMSDKVVKGDLSARVGIRPAGEMGSLCRAIDQMADAVEEREKQLKIATSRQLSQSAKLASIGRLAAGIAHEINNPLTGVLTFAHLLQQSDKIDEQSKEDLGVIIRETTRVRGIVRGLLDFARESPPQKQWIDVNDVIMQTTTLVKSQKEFHKVTIVEDLGSGLPSILGDKNQLQQVFLNISLNACEAMEGGGTLKISTALDDGNVHVAFQDTGCGIKEEHLDDIFEPFFTTKPPTKGTGLGLSVSYGIVQRHGGTIEVESAVGKGSTFTVVLPVEAHDKKEEEKK